jgi:hypothetical protein
MVALAFYHHAMIGTSNAALGLPMPVGASQPGVAS